MKIEQSPDRYITVVFDDGIIARWRQPYLQSFLPRVIEQMIFDSAAGDTLAMEERRVLRSRYNLTVE